MSDRPAGDGDITKGVARHAATPANGRQMAATAPAGRAGSNVQQMEGLPAAVLPPSALPPAVPGVAQVGGGRPSVAFDRRELDTILRLYGRMVAAGEWRDYAMDFGREEAVFSVFRRTSEMPLYRIVKAPKLARKQGAYAVVAPGGRILKRGSELARVLQVLEPKTAFRLVD